MKRCWIDATIWPFFLSRELACLVVVHSNVARVEQRCFLLWLAGALKHLSCRGCRVFVSREARSDEDFVRHTCCSLSFTLVVED